MIELDSIVFAYAQKNLLFRQFNWQVEQGQSWAVLGPSGCGKTTLLYLLAGLIFPSAGQVRVDGQALTRPRPETGLILQDYGLLPWNTVQDNIRLGLRIRQFYGPDGKHAPRLPQNAGADARRWISRLGLSGLEQRFPGQLSGGQRQRVAIARTLVLQPDLLLMDEPFSSLDAPTRISLRELTLSLWAEQRFTFIVVTHAIEEAAHLGQKILLLGQPPHTRAEIIQNPCFGQPNFTESSEYHALTRLLRERMVESV
jgi:ABC-type nitrate/sulfonate/bicarbonate transport system ATPase subunit